MNLDYLDFEQPIAELESKIDELRLVGNDSDINIKSSSVINFIVMVFFTN